jgi:hypothetical protein
MTNADLEGFRTSSRNVYFENGILFSYGSHYPMARKLSVGTGHAYREIVLINAEKSTNTTEKHKSQIRQSTLKNQWTFSVPNIHEPKARENAEYLMNEVVDSIDAVLRGLKYDYVDQVTRKIEHYNQYARAFKLKEFSLKAEFYTILSILSRDTEAKNEEREKIRDAERAANRAANRAKWASEVALWYKCQNTMNISSSFFGLNYDPIRVNGDKVETPRGAELDLSIAKAIASRLKQGRLLVGQSVGPFKIDKITSETLEVGCHTINIQQALAALEGN